MSDELICTLKGVSMEVRNLRDSTNDEVNKQALRKATKKLDEAIAFIQKSSIEFSEKRSDN